VTDEPPLPVDSDMATAHAAAGRPTPVHLSWPNIGLVTAGGIAGTGLRYLIAGLVPPRLGIPIAILAINLAGAFLLGLLLQLLAKHGPEVGWSRRLRLVVGTGMLGGFTTYSALATDTATLALTHPGRAAGYALATVLVGAAASVAGIVLSRHRQRPAPTDPTAR
jgi:fluoride exporter